MSKLTVYKASAGSGKTFRLALEYIKLVLNQPTAYRHILAVTFTNKATAEMKGRILNEMHKLATNAESGMRSVLMDETGLDADTIMDRAQQALSNILHDYSMFSVSTIDSFVQRVIRSLLWELEVHSNTDLKLDPEPYVDRAVDRLLDESRNEKALYEHLKKMLYSQLDDEKTPSIDKELKSLGNELFKEQYRKLSKDERDKMADRSTIEAIMQQNKQAIAQFENNLHSMAQEMQEIMESNGLYPDSFSQKEKGIGGFPQKCMQATANDIIDEKFINTYHQKAYDDSNSWFSGKNKNPKQGVVDAELHQRLVRLIDYIKTNKPAICTHFAVQKNLSTLWLISGIRSKIKELCNEDNAMLLADSGPTLREFVRGEDTPFVYEKVGIRYNHIMLDEFQDTSQIQWDNFRPLIENSLGQDYMSLVVGDVKQAIYRWRNSDWQILGKKIAEELPTVTQKLDTNYRSRKHIVEFNNHIFSKISELLPLWAAEQSASAPQRWQELAQPVFDNPTQKAKHTEGGYVEVQRVLSKNKAQHLCYLQQRLPELVQSLLGRGYRPCDIAVLVRKHDEGQMVAKILVSSGISIVSQDAMVLSASRAVRLCVAVMAYIYDNDNTIALGELMREAYLITHPNADLDWATAFDRQTFEELHGDFIKSQQHRSMGQIFETIVEHFALDTLQDELPYIAALHEQIIKLPHEGGASIEHFVNWWKEAGHKHKLALPDNEQSVSVVTIHKSKGLEYPVVIMPFANIEIFGNQKNMIWTSVDHDFYNSYPLYLIDINKMLKDSSLCDEYTNDRVQSMIDAMNMLYVALTRPEHELYMMINVKEQKELKKEDITHVEQWVWPAVQEFCGSCTDSIQTIVVDTDTLLLSELDSSAEGSDEEVQANVEDKVHVSTCTLGTPQPPQRSAQPSSAGKWILDSYSVSNTPPPIATKLSTGAVFGQSAEPKAVERGNIMHQLYSLIETHADIPKALDTLQLNGLITNEQRQALEPQIHEQLQHQPYADWFGGCYEVLNERNIISPGQLLHRPDRVMLAPDRTIVVDYKFGGRLPKHKQQVRRYMQLLQQMGLPAVEGHVWYVDENERDTVE